MMVLDGDFALPLARGSGGRNKISGFDNFLSDSPSILAVGSRGLGSAKDAPDPEPFGRVRAALDLCRRSADIGTGLGCQPPRAAGLPLQ